MILSGFMISAMWLSGARFLLILPVFICISAVAEFYSEFRYYRAIAIIRKKANEQTKVSDML